MFAKKDSTFKTLPASSGRGLAYRAIAARGLRRGGEVQVEIEDVSQPVQHHAGAGLYIATNHLVQSGAVFLGGSIVGYQIDALSPAMASTGLSTLGSVLLNDPSIAGQYVSGVSGGGSFGFGALASLSAGVTVANVVGLGAYLSGGSFSTTTPVSASTEQQTENSPGEAALSRWAWLQQRLLTWSKLPVDWDGEDGQPPNLRAVGGASHFLSRAQAAGVPLPETYVAGDGEVGYRWRGTDKFASAAFLPDGHIVAFARSPNQPTYRLDEPYVADLALGDFFARLKDFA